MKKVFGEINVLATNLHSIGFQSLYSKSEGGDANLKAVQYGSALGIVFFEDFWHKCFVLFFRNPEQMIFGIVKKDFFNMFENSGDKLRIKAKSDGQYTIGVVCLTFVVK